MGTFAILVAAGSGSRMDPNQSASIPKVLYPIGGTASVTTDGLRANTRSTTVVEFVSSAFSAVGLFDKLVLVVASRFLQEFSQLNLPTNVQIVEGGATRADSVRRGLAVLKGESDDSIVAVHDAARPFVSQRVLRECVAACRQSGAVTAAVSVVDTLSEATGGECTHRVDRSKLWQIQTPQVFNLGVLRDAHGDCEAATTDDAGLVSKHHAVQIVVGDRWNFKLTTPDDYQMACVLAASASFIDLLNA